MRRRRGPRRLLAPLIALRRPAGLRGAVAVVVLDPFARDDRREVAERFAAAWAADDRRTMHGLIDAETRARLSAAALRGHLRAVERAATVPRCASARRASRATVGSASRSPSRRAPSGRCAATSSCRWSSRGGRGARALAPVPAPARPAPRRARAPAHRRPAEARARARRRRDAPDRGRRRRRSSAARRRPSDPGSGLERRFDRAPAGTPGRAAALRRPRRRARARLPRALVRDHDPPRPAARVARRARRAPRRRRRAAPARRRRRSRWPASPCPRPSRPGSTFKIVTLAAALRGGRRDGRRARIPCARYATLSGVRLRNANDEACGGTLVDVVRRVVQLGLRAARRAARREPAGGRYAEAFGFNERPRDRRRRARAGFAPASRLRRQPRRRRGGDRPGSRPGHAAGDGQRRRDDRQPRRPRAAADRAQRARRPPPRGAPRGSRARCAR